MVTLEDIQARLATLELTQAELLTALKTVGATQRVIADALREFSQRIATVESMANDTNRNARSLVEATTEFKELLIAALNR